MGNSTSRVVGCFVPLGNEKGGVDLEFLEPLDEGLGHSFCYVRQMILDSPSITPSNSERFTVDSSTLDSETLSGSFRREIVEDPLSLQRPNKNFPETTFKTISGASVSANVSTARTGNQSALCASDTQEPAASFESTSSFAAIPLQPVPRGSRPLNGFMSGPLERGFASGPLERGGGFMSGPIEKGAFMSGPLDSTDKANFSAPLAYNRRGPGLRRLVRSMSGPMKSALTRTFSRHSMGSGWMHRFFLHPVTQFIWHHKEPKFRPEAPQQCIELGPSEEDYRNTRNLQWAHGKAGEDRVHVVLSEEQGWLFVGIYDGFSGPDAPDFLMNHLYKAIDRELEGLLWDYEGMSVNNPSHSEFLDNDNVGISECREEDLQNSQSSEVVLHSGLEEPLDLRHVNVQVSNHEIVEEKDEVTERLEVQSVSGNNDDPRRKPSVLFTEAFSASPPKLGGQGRRSKRLYELLQMELSDAQGSTPLSEVGKEKEGLSDLQPSSEGLYSRKTLPEAMLMSCSVNPKGDSSSCSAADSSIIGEDVGTAGAESRPGAMASFSASGQRHSTKKSLIGSKIRKMYRKQKSLRKKLFPWSYDWHREETHANERNVEPLGLMRRCKSGLVDHDAVLRAMSRALQNTEEAYMDMVEAALDRNPELALMGSCVLVMLMKDQDVYVMNLGDSRVILAQERQSDHHPNPNLVKDDSRYWNRSRESLVRVELDRISEESPMHNQNSRVNKINKSREISLCRLKMRAIQLSTDHSTSEEEVCSGGSPT